MKYAVWLKYPTASRKTGPFYPRVVDAVSVEDAVETYIRETNRASVTGDSDFMVTTVSQMVVVQRRRRQEYDLRVVHCEVEDEDDD